MTNPVLRIEDWLDLPGTAPEIPKSFGRLFFGCSPKTFTAHRSGSEFRQSAFLPAYPLALWIAQSWWRLFYESEPRHKSYEWDATHCMRFAGNGFLWPDVWMLPDGINMDVRAEEYIADAEEPVEYLYSESKGIPIPKLEACFSQFIDSTIERIDDYKSNLALLWKEILKERKSESLSFFRKLEAVLGYDPDGISETELLSLTDYGGIMGKNYLLEFLTAFRQSGIAEDDHIQEKIDDLLQVEGVRGQFDLPAPNALISGQPWDIGRALAHDLRAKLGLQGKVSTDNLRSITGISKKDFDFCTHGNVPFSIGKKEDDAYTFTFLKDRKQSRRFQVARYVGDYYTSMLNSRNDEWLIVSDSQTFRQKVQRAFGAEFLLPVALIQEHTEGDYSPTKVKQVAQEFDVSTVLAATQLANHKLIQPNEIVLYS